MKKNIILTAVVSTLLISACNNGEKNTEHDMSKMGSDTVQHATSSSEGEIKSVAVSFTNVDPKAAATIKEIVDQYLSLKNALANDNSNDAAVSGKSMVSAIAKLDKSLLSIEQKKVFDENQDDLKEHAEHISENAKNIKHQREHFVGMSEDMYALVKAFGAGRPLYHDHCPMAQENKGAMWISEVKDIKNPYFGAEMSGCGTIEEVIK
ncbi:DUF3347 domain-containing protein [Aquirufa nivalisilvae]